MLILKSKTGRYPLVNSLNNDFYCCWVTKPCLTLGTPWTGALQAPLSMRFPRQGYWSGLSFLSPGYLPDPGIKLSSLAWQVNSLQLSHQRNPNNDTLILKYLAYHRASTNLKSASSRALFTTAYWEISLHTLILKAVSPFISFEVKFLASFLGSDLSNKWLKL